MPLETRLYYGRFRELNPSILPGATNVFGLICATERVCWLTKKRIYRLLSENNLLATQTQNNRAKRTPTRSKPRANKPNEIWGIDMTKVMVDSWGWVYLHVALNWGSKRIVGWQFESEKQNS